jgi:hypothetical protein
MPRDQVFISYSHKDKKWLEKFQTMLRPLVRNEIISVWEDTKISAGEEWRDKIKDALAAAKVAVLLVSPHFLGSDFIVEHELPPLLDAAKKEGLVILWVYISHCLYDETLLAAYQASNEIAKPLDRLTPGQQNAVLADICRKIKAAANRVDRLSERESGAAGPQSVPPIVAPPSQVLELFAPRSDPNLDRLTEGFCGRDWLFDKLKDRTSAFPGLLLLGGPGTGKSAIIAKLLRLNNFPILAYHFFQAGARQTLRPAVLINNLAARIANRFPEYKKRLEEHAATIRRATLTGTLVDEEKCDTSPGSAIQEYILTPLGSLPSMQSVSTEGRHYILLDALNEALSSEHEYKEPILRGLRQLERQLPDWLRIIATSRDDPSVTEQIGLNKFDINAERVSTRQDIKTYINNCLERPDLNIKLGHSNLSADQITCLLCDKASGNFLYAKYALELVKQLDTFSFDDLNALRPGLGSIYSEFFDRQFKGKDYSAAARMLQVLVAAKEPLTEGELAIATGVGSPESQALSEAFRCLKSYFSSEAEEKYKLYHESFREWLASPGSGRYHVEPLKGHEQLAAFCWNDYENARHRRLRPALYTCRYGVTHLIEAQRYAQAVQFLYWLNKHKDLLKKEKDSSELVSRLAQFAKVLSIALSEEPHLKSDEARRVDPDKLKSLLQPLYMTEALYGGLELLVRYHPEAWPRICEEFLATQDYVLRYTMSEVLGQAYLVEEDPQRLDEICKLAEHSDIGHQEVGYHALRFIIAQNSELFNESKYIRYMQRLADFPTYPGRSILGDLLLNLTLQNKDKDISLRPAKIMKLVDPRCRFWNPIWRFQQMDISALIASNYFVRGESLPEVAADGVRSAYTVLVKTEERKAQLLNNIEKTVWPLGARSMRGVSALLSSYYQLAIKTDEQIRADLAGLKDKDNGWLKDVFEVLFAYALWEVVEKTASVLASIVDDNPRAVEVVKKLFVHDIWRVRYGAAETAFLASFDRDRELFSDAVKRFYKEDEPLLRGNCAENLAAWILETQNQEERAELLEKFREQIETWLKDDDCWVLDHMYRLFWKLAQEEQEQEEDFAFLLRSGISPLLEGDGGVWYRLDRKDFLKRIEENKLARTPFDGCPKT